MRKSILTLLLVSIFAFTFSFGLIGCKKADAPEDEATTEEAAMEEESGDMAKEASEMGDQLKDAAKDAAVEAAKQGAKAGGDAAKKKMGF